VTENIFELPARPDHAEPRVVTPADFARFERYAAEIFEAFGMDLDTPGTRETPRRFLRALYDATSGYDGDAKLRTAFPSERPDGISKLTRLVRLYARRFTVQERLGEQIADALVELVRPRGVAVHLEAEHLCTQMRGVHEETSRTTTTFWRGLYDEDADLRREFLASIR
jgi:GTP cyclohydrolase I